MKPCPKCSQSHDSGQTYGPSCWRNYQRRYRDAHRQQYLDAQRKHNRNTRYIRQDLYRKFKPDPM